MKQKKSFLLAASVVVLAACSSNDLSESPAAQPQQVDDSAITFGAYVNRGVTRAGAVGTLTTNGDAPAVSLQNVGFGVFSYYSDSESYCETSKPNFMYNQKVSMPDGVNWTYSPMKYWPNEFGKNATSEGQDRLTFFAYAPYVNVNPSTGRVIKGENDGDNGIVGLTSNTASGDPYVKYYVDMDPDKRVDLCWGVAKQQFNARVDEEAINLIDAGWPYIDVVKPTTNSKIDFDFKHALAAVNVQIDTDVDVTGHDDNAADVDRYTRIWVRSVTFEGFTDKGRLNLNSNADPNSAESGPQWIDLTTDSPVASGVVTVYDGRTDGKEGRDNAIAKKESPATLNAKIIQSAPYSKQALENADEAARMLTISEAVPGVTKAKVNLFDSDALEAPVYVIPTDDNLKVTIVYDVETYDPNLAAFLSDGSVKGSSVQNTIEKEITFQPESGDAITKLEAGKSYTINLHLGLTSVKFDAVVTEWADGTNFNVDLPYNYTTQYYTAEEADAYNRTLDGAVQPGDEKTPAEYYTEDEIAGHNAIVDIWTAPRVKTPAEYYTEDEIAGHNATLDIWTAPKAKEGYFSFESFETADPTHNYGSGTVVKVSDDGVNTIVQVVTNTIDGFVGQQFKVHAVDLTGGTEFELFTVDGDAPTGVSVRNVAQVNYTEEEIAAHNATLDIWTAPRVKTEEVLYTEEEIAEHNALPENTLWDATTEKTAATYWTEEDANAYNAALPGAKHAGDPK